MLARPPRWLPVLVGAGLGWVGVVVFPQLLTKTGLLASLLVLAILARALVPPARQANRRMLLGGVVGWVVAVAGPRGEDEEDLGALLGRDAVTLSRLEGEQCAWLRFDDARSRFDVR